MKEYDISESAYNNGYKEGYSQAMEDIKMERIPKEEVKIHYDVYIKDLGNNFKWRIYEDSSRLNEKIEVAEGENKSLNNAILEAFDKRRELIENNNN